MFLLFADAAVEFPLDRAAWYQETYKEVVSQRFTCLDCLDNSEGKNKTPLDLNWHLSIHSDDRSAEQDGLAKHSNIINLKDNIASGTVKWYQPIAACSSEPPQHSTSLCNREEVAQHKMHLLEAWTLMDACPHSCHPLCHAHQRLQTGKH